MSNEMKSLEQQQKVWNDRLRTKTPSEIILWAIKEFTPGSLFQTTAFGATGMVIRDMIYKVQHEECGKDQIPIILIDTLYHFKETPDLMERLKSIYDDTPVNIFKPDGCETVQDFELKFGQKLWEIDGDKYEYVTKAEPGHRACLNLGARAVFTERRKSQGADGANLHIIELDFALSPPLVKINPLVDWDYEQVWSYIKENSVPYNTLHDEEYTSIGDTHSSVSAKAGQAKTECGLHKDYLKLKQAAASSNSLSIKGPFLLHNVWKGLELNAAHLQTIKSIDYSFSTGINVILSSSISLIPPKLEHSFIESDYTHLDKFVVTIISSSPLTYQNIARILEILKLIFSAKPLHTSASEVFVLELQIGIRKEEFEAIALELFKLSQIEKIDLNIQKETVFRKHKRLVIFDMDSTLIQQEVIDELAREAGVFDKISAITESAMRGEIDFNESLRQRVGLLAGTPASVIEIVRGRIQFTPGAQELCRALKRLGYKLAVLSGGFMPLALYVKSTLGLDYAFANNLEISPDGQFLTGKVSGTIVNGEKKADFLRVIAALENVPTDQIVAVGDGANDLLMMAEASLGVAFKAKPKVQQLASTRINQSNLIYILYLLGYSKPEIESLLDF